MYPFVPSTTDADVAAAAAAAAAAADSRVARQRSEPTRDSVVGRQ